MRAARKQLSLTQESVAKQLGISQSALSKLERGTLIPSAPQWFEFCRMTEIAPASIKTGVIERMRPAVLEDALRVGSFKLPRKYARRRGSKARALIPFFLFLEQAVGEKAYFDFFKDRKVDADFFIDLDNQIALEFLLDLARVLIDGGHLRPENLPALTVFAGSARTHGSLAADYARQASPLDRVAALLANAGLYECNFRYAIQDRGPRTLDFSIESEAHVDWRRSLADPALSDFLWNYKKSYFEGFLAAAAVSEASNSPDARSPAVVAWVDELERDLFALAPRAIYRVRLREDS
jgi:DNA-binding XRE family transcriptional regulator